MTDPTDGRDAAGRPVPGAGPPGGLPPHLNPRGPRGALPPRPPRTVPRADTPATRPVLPGTGSRRDRRRRTTRILSWLAAITSVALLAAAAGGYVLINHYDSNITRLDVFDEEAGDRPVVASTDAQNILIVGSDSRGDLAAGEGSQGTGDEFVTGQRSDTVILAHLYGDSDTAQLISFPRDAWVTIPEHVSEAGEVVPAREDKLNAAFFQGGPPLLIRTIEQLTNLRVDNYMQIDFDGFQSMVNTLGGVEVCLSEPAKEKDSGIDLEAGRQTIQGDQALAFVRQRKGLPRGDIDRIGRQQQFIGAIVRKTLSAGTLLNPFRLNGVVTVATESLEVDEELSIADLRDLALRFRNFNAGGVVFSTVPIEDIAGRRRGQDVVLLDEAAMAVLFDALRRDVPPVTPGAPDPGSGPAPLVVAPEAVQVQVFNGAGVTGLGRRAYDDLAAVDFQVVGSPGNRGDMATSTIVFHGRDQADAARTVVAALPGSTAQLNPSLGRALEVVVGSSYTEALPVTVERGAAAPVPPPAADAPAPPPVQTAADDPCAP